MELREDEIRRYARQLILPEFGGAAQQRLKAATVTVIGAGGLGSPLLLYLAGAGVGRLRIVDDDRVDLGNLHRQVLFTTTDVGRPKAEAAAQRLAALNPAITLEPIAVRLDESNAATLLAGSDVVADGSDRIETRWTVAEACRAGAIPLVSVSVQGTAGQLAVWRPHLGPPHPCLACLFADRPDPTALPTCASAGVLGPAAGMLGTMQAVEVIRLLAGLEDPPVGELVQVEVLARRIWPMRVPRRAECSPRCVRSPEPIPG